MRNLSGPHYGRIIVPCLIVVCFALFTASADAKTGESKDLLQFASGSHVVGFRESSVYLASTTHMLKVDFMGGKSVTPLSKEGLPGAGGTRALTRVTYPQVWDGVDIVYEKGENAIMKSTYTISSGKEPRSIRLGYNRPLAIDKKGNLVITYDTGRLTESKPIAWQVVEGKKKPVMVAYNLYSEKELGFVVGDYDKNLPLVIDPSLSWNTFLGSSANDQGWAMAVDSSGNVYVTGYSAATWGSPVRAYTAGWDCFVAKLDTQGELIWNTFLGGAANYEYGQAIAVDSSGNVYVAGGGDGTWGSPVRAYTAGWDCFVAKLTTNGTLLWNTFLGDSLDEGGRALAVDSNRNVYVTGYSEETWGSPVRAYTAGDDAFVAKLAADGALAWNTFLGGAGGDYGFGIALDGNGNIYVAGQSYAEWGSPIRAYEALDDAFVARLTADGALTWNTFLGGSGVDSGHAIAVVPGEGVFVAGSSDVTWGSPFRPYSEYYDAFAARLTLDGVLTWNTFLGGSGVDNGYGIGVDLSGGVYVAGVSWDTWGAPIRPYEAASDIFVAKIFDGNPCRYTITPSGKSFTYMQGSVTVTVSATGGIGCASPIVSTGDAWITPSLTSFRNNKGRVKIAVPKNTTALERNGTVTIEGNTFAVIQKGLPCSITSISPSYVTMTSQGGPGSFSVTAIEGCPWTVEVAPAVASWLSASSSSGSGSSTVSYTASANTTTRNRTGKVTVYLTNTPVKKKVFTISQKR